MNVLIIGATRGIGFQVLQHALEKDHTVTVLARSPGKLALKHERLRVMQGDIRDEQVVGSATQGQDAVVCCIGIMPTLKPVTVFSDGIQNVLASMDKNEVKLLISVTGIGAGDSRGHGGFFYDKIFQPLLLKTIYADKDHEESLIKGSQVNWIIVRPGFLTNGPMTGTYRVLTDMNDVKAGKISRADVAHFILDQLDSPKYLRQTPLLAYS
jgi:putative NADH-flavin reductase